MKTYLKKYNKEDFKNVYFIAGTATGGKTTMSKVIAEKYGFVRYDADAEFDKHQKLSNPIEQPNMNKKFANADDFFMRDVNEYMQWLKDNAEEQMDFIFKDLKEISKNQKVVCDLHLTPEEASVISDYDRVIFLIRESNDQIIEEYCNRKNFEGFKRYINSTTNPDLAKQNCNEVLRRLNNKKAEDIRKSGFKYIERNTLSTVEKTLKMVEEHFHLQPKYDKELLKNVYFISGTSAGGKSTISKLLAEKYGFALYVEGKEVEKHQNLSDPTNQPYLSQKFNNADEFFMRTTDDYKNWLINTSREQLDFVVKDLIELSKNQKVICDIHLPVQYATYLTDYDRIIFLIKDNYDNIIEEYYNREDHSGFRNYINSTTNPELAKKNCNEVLRRLNTKRCEDIKKSDYFYVERNPKSTIENTIKQVENHFGLSV